MILVGKNHKGMLKKNVSPIPSTSHHVTAVQGGYPRLARVSTLSLGTSHAWHPRQPLGTALTTAPLKKHATGFMPEKLKWQKKKGKKVTGLNITPPPRIAFVTLNLHHLQQSLGVAAGVHWGSAGRGRGLHAIFYVSFLLSPN